MVHVYILLSKTTHRYYVGSTKDVENRLKEHNAGESSSTRSGVPWKLVWVETFHTRGEAMLHEKQIKSRGAARYLESVAQPG